MYEQVIQFWFEEIEQAKWWRKDKTFDALISERFGGLHHSVAKGESFHWRETAEGRLAEIIVLDQFSRNMYRDKPLSFAFDGMALLLAQTAVELGADASLSSIQKSFLYMPYMHSESLMVHDEAVKLYGEAGLENNLDFEMKHRDIIERFGRYPHRNTILGRESSPEELAFLETPGSSF